MTMDLSSAAQTWLNLLLIWLGFGTLVGLSARALLPGGGPRGLLGVLAVGVAGSCVGPIVYTLVFRPENFHPISPVGLGVSVVTALIFLLLYRLGSAAAKKSKRAKE